MCCFAVGNTATKSMTEKNGGTVNLSVIAFALVGGSLFYPFLNLVLGLPFYFKGWYFKI